MFTKSFRSQPSRSPSAPSGHDTSVKSACLCRWQSEVVVLKRLTTLCNWFQRGDGAFGQIITSVSIPETQVSFKVRSGSEIWRGEALQLLGLSSSRKHCSARNKRMYNVVYAIQCNRDSTHLYIGETKHLLRSTLCCPLTSGGENEFLWGQQHKHLSQRRQMVWKKEVEESIYVRLERPSLNRGGGLPCYLSPTYNAVPSSLPRQLNNHSHLVSPSLSSSHGGLENGPNDSETQSSRVPKRPSASCYRKVAGSIPLVWESKCPRARYWTPNCPWCARWHLAWQQSVH